MVRNFFCDRHTLQTHCLRAYTSVYILCSVCMYIYAVRPVVLIVILQVVQVEVYGIFIWPFELAIQFCTIRLTYFFLKALDRFLWQQKVAKKMNVLCAGLVECGGVLVQNSKVQVTPTRGQKIENGRDAYSREGSHVLERISRCQNFWGRAHLSQQAAASGRWSVRLDQHQNKLDDIPMTQR